MFAAKLPESIIKRLSIRARELGAVNLGQGIPSFPTAAHIIQAAKTALDDPGIGVYPNFLGEIELREAIAAKINQAWKLDLSGSQHVLVTVGAMEATATAILGVVEDGEIVGIVTPDYCNHLPQAILARARVVEIPLSESDSWRPDLPAIEKAAQAGMKFLILTNPGNPTGVVFSKSELDGIVGLARQYDFWVLADETYGYLTYEHEFISLLAYWGRHDKLLVVHSFSKEYAMTGWRVGYLLARPEQISQLAKVHDALTGCVPKISQRAAVSALTSSQDIVSEYRAKLQKRQSRVISGIAGIAGLHLAAPHGAYYAFVRYPGSMGSVEVADQLLNEVKVAVVPGVAFGKAGEQHFRISFAVDDTVLQDGLQRIAEYFTGRK